MKIGILETGEVHPDLKARHGDYPAMFRGCSPPPTRPSTSPTVRVVAGEMPAAPSQADAWLVTGSRHGVYDDLPWIEPLEGVPARLRRRARPGGRHLLRPPDPRRGARRPGGEVGPRLGPRRAGLRARRASRLDGGVPDRFAVGRCTRTRSSRSPGCHRSRPLAALRVRGASPTAIPSRPTRSPPAAPRVRRRVHGRAPRAAGRHGVPGRGGRRRACLARPPGRRAPPGPG